MVENESCYIFQLTYKVVEFIKGETQMNYEQKYKSALEWMRSIYPTMQGADKEDAEHFFPELRESEYDRIRKELYDFITCQYGSIDDMHYHSWISWITKRKQGSVEQDTETHDLWVYIREWNDRFGRLPKDEDELASCIDYVMKRQKPADKVDALMSLDEAIEHCKEKSCGNNTCALEHQQLANWLIELKELKEQKPTWSEKHIADVFEKVGLARIVREQGNDQLTDAVQSAMIELSKQQKTAWSEEDEKKTSLSDYDLSMIDNLVTDENCPLDSEYISWLKSLKDRIQPKQEWSEEDKNMLLSIINDAEQDALLDKEQINWLKSLKPDRWKPSEEQMEALVIAVHDAHGRSYYEKLFSIYNDLKSL